MIHLLQFAPQVQRPAKLLIFGWPAHVGSTFATVSSRDFVKVVDLWMVNILVITLVTIFSTCFYYIIYMIYI